MLILLDDAILFVSFKNRELSVKFWIQTFPPCIIFCLFNISGKINSKTTNNNPIYPKLIFVKLFRNQEQLCKLSQHFWWCCTY